MRRVFYVVILSFIICPAKGVGEELLSGEGDPEAALRAGKASHYARLSPDVEAAASPPLFIERAQQPRAPRRGRVSLMHHVLDEGAYLLATGTGFVASVLSYFEMWELSSPLFIVSSGAFFLKASHYAVQKCRRARATPAE